MLLRGTRSYLFRHGGWGRPRITHRDKVPQDVVRQSSVPRTDLDNVYRPTARPISSATDMLKHMWGSLET